MLLVMIPLIYLVFSPIFFDNQMDMYDKAKAQMYTYLDRVQVEGYLTAHDEAQMYDAFNKIGCPIQSLQCPRESQGDARVLRDSSSLATSLITMRITCIPDQNGLKIGKLVGVNTADYDITLKGSVVSERVDP